VYANLLNWNSILWFGRAIVNDPEIWVKIFSHLRDFTNNVIAMSRMARKRVGVRPITRPVNKDFYGL